MKFHISLDVSNLNQSLDFYRTLFAVEPSKVKPGYAKFDLEEPALVLTLGENKGGCGCISGLNHMGLRVSSLEEVTGAKERLTAGNFATEDEMNTTCCYAVQDKIWAKDPDGYRWEVYVFKADADTANGATLRETACCAK